MMHRIKGLAAVVLAGLLNADPEAAFLLWSTTLSSAPIATTTPNVAVDLRTGATIARRPWSRFPAAAWPRFTSTNRVWPTKFVAETCVPPASAIFRGETVRPGAICRAMTSANLGKGFVPRHYVLLSLRPLGVAGWRALERARSVGSSRLADFHNRSRS